MKFFQENSLAGNFFSFVNGEGVSLILSRPTMNYMTDLFKSGLFIIMITRDDDDDIDIGVDDGGVIYINIEIIIFCTQDQVLLALQLLPVWTKNPF